MKKTIIIAALAMFTSLSSQAQFTFSVSPGLQLNGASFGYKVQKFVPYLSFQMLNVKGEVIDAGKENDFNTGMIVDFKDTYSAKLSVMMPTLGLRYYFLESNKLKAYGNLSFSKAILSGKVEDSTDPAGELDDDYQEILKNTKVSAFQFGFGTEYFFDEQFSLGGEFGLNMLRIKSSQTYTTILNDPFSGNSIEVTNSIDLKGNFNPTYAKITLNFYFAK